MSKLKPGKSPGRDNIHPEFVIHQSTTTSGWLCAFYTSCYQRLKLPKTWRRASVIALPKPNKPAEDPKSYRPISLLCVPFKILERMIHSRIEPVVDSQLPREQAGFRHGRSIAHQVTLLCQDIEDSFQDNEKAGVVYLDLTAAYDTVWHRGLHLKLLRTIPDRHMVKFIMETLSNCSFIFQTSSGQCSRLRRLKNGVPQGSVLSPMLFNVYIHDLPDTASRKDGYADDLAIMLSRPMWKLMEEGLNEDMGTLVAYLRRWCLQLSVGKSVAAAYHLSTREARRELEVRVDNKCLEVQQARSILECVWIGHYPSNNTWKKSRPSGGSRRPSTRASTCANTEAANQAKEKAEKKEAEAITKAKTNTSTSGPKDAGRKGLNETQWDDRVVKDVEREWLGDVFVSQGEAKARGVAILVRQGVVEGYFLTENVEPFDWVRQPFTNCSSNNLPSELEDALIELSSDRTLQASFASKTLDEFWLSVVQEYPGLSKAAMDILTPFGSTYLCEKTFSSLAYIKNKYRCRLNSMEENLRVAVSSIDPRIDLLCSRKQAHPSH
ncbi:hypothetical protein NHX12_012734 [Muraenolepis orangiensis]|uniref:Reverse transcriptase domain-containing protein n=1 Tax=Muraenolepis orangiensis TaxID=630683 RepID=A0A9Q0DDA8_9TELE|nr:hypothetical protein NHX12_012734 [Muraenolepis orangiensis]